MTSAFRAAGFAGQFHLPLAMAHDAFIGGCAMLLWGDINGRGQFGQQAAGIGSDSGYLVLLGLRSISRFWLRWLGAMMRT